jgi:hypothetical protein
MITKAGGPTNPREEVLRPAANIASTITMMVRYGRPCVVRLERGLTLAMDPDRFFSISRAGEVGPSQVEVNVVCDKSQASVLPLKSMDAKPDSVPGRTFVWWALTLIPIDEVNDGHDNRSKAKFGYATAARDHQQPRQTNSQREDHRSQPMLI